MQILTVSGLQKTYTTRFGGSKVQALKNVNFTVESGEYVAIMGESGRQMLSSSENVSSRLKS